MAYGTEPDNFDRPKTPKKLKIYPNPIKEALKFRRFWMMVKQNPKQNLPKSWVCLGQGLHRC